MISQSSITPFNSSHTTKLNNARMDLNLMKLKEFIVQY